MQNLRIVTAIGLLASAAAAHAGVSSTWTLTNDYDFRGNSQSAKDPALQASIDYTADSGWYAGAWASNVDFGDQLDVDYEIDVYAGLAKSYDSGFGWDTGLVYYGYPEESDFNYFEIYGGFSYDWFKAKLSYSDAYGGDAAEAAAVSLVGDDAVSAWYLEGNATLPLAANFSVLLHAGYSTGDYWDNVFGDDQFDYSVGIGYARGNFNLVLKYADTDGDVVVESDEFNNEGRVLFTIATTFPRGGE